MIPLDFEELRALELGRAPAQPAIESVVERPILEEDALVAGCERGEPRLGWGVLDPREVNPGGRRAKSLELVANGCRERVTTIGPSVDTPGVEGWPEGVIRRASRREPRPGDDPRGVIARKDVRRYLEPQVAGGHTQVREHGPQRYPGRGVPDVVEGLRPIGQEDDAKSLAVP